MTSNEGNDKSKTAILNETVESPDADCTQHELFAKKDLTRHRKMVDNRYRVLEVFYDRSLTPL